MGVNSIKSHMPILMKLIESFEINKVLEFGIGLNSTKLFVEKCQSVLSIEMNDHKINNKLWYDVVADEIGGKPNWEKIYLSGAYDGISYVKTKILEGEKWDLVFVDGYGDTRAQQANIVFDHADFVVIHDSQHKMTHENFKFNSQQYYRVDFVDYCIKYASPQDEVWPWTTVFSRSQEDYEIIKKWLKIESDICQIYFETK